MAIKLTGTIMKNTGECPKCRSHHIVEVKGRLTEEITVGLGRVVHPLRLICGECGYTEQWIETKEDLAAVNRRHAHAVTRD